MVATAVAALLMGASTVSAATIEKDGDTATAIRGLQVGSVTYDVEFISDTNDFGPWQPFTTLDFNDKRDAEDAVDAVVALFNSQGGINRVGPSANDSFVSFHAPYSFTTIPVFGQGPTRYLVCIQGTIDDRTRWGNANTERVVFGDRAGMARFTEVGEGGPGNTPPRAKPGGPYEGTAGSPVDFDGSDSSDSDGSIESWDWAFGDGGTASGATTSYTYGAAGTYNVTLTVTDNSGDSNSASTNAVIGADSQPPLAVAGGPYQGTVGSSVRFDGTGSRDADGSIQSYAWEFGDGGVGSGPTPRHTYNDSGDFTVTLTVTDDSGETGDDTTKVTVGVGNRPPVAEAGGPYIGSAGVPKDFDGSGSNDPDGDIDTYTWNFGDGSPTRTGRTPSYTYAQPGVYSVSLTVTDDDGVTASDGTTAVIGDGEPDLIDRMVDLATLGDAAGSNNSDLAVLSVGLANGDQISARVHLHDGGTGNEIYQVELTDSWRSLALDAVDGNSGPLLAVLQKGSDGELRVQLLNASDGTVESNIPYFEIGDWTAIDLLAVRDAGGPGIGGIGVLAENPAGQQAIEVHTVGNGALVNQVLFFNDIWKASHAVDLGEFNGNGRSELAVLATNNASKHAVETKDVLSGKQISRHFFLGPTNTVIGLADSADVDGGGRPELIVLGNKDAANNTANTAQAKDVKTGALISKPGSFPPPFVGFALRSMDDADGNSSPEMVIGAFDGFDVTRVQVRDVMNGTLTLNTGMLSAAFDPRDLEILEDVSGNGVQELAAAGVDRQTLAIRVQTRDGQSGALLLNIDIN